MHSVVVPLASKNLKHFPNSRELRPKPWQLRPLAASGGRKAEGGILSAAACLGQLRGRSQVSQPHDKKTYSTVPFLHTSAEDAAPRTWLFLGTQDTELSFSFLTEGDSAAAVCAAELGPLCSLRLSRRGLMGFLFLPPLFPFYVLYYKSPSSHCSFTDLGVGDLA